MAPTAIFIDQNGESLTTVSQLPVFGGLVIVVSVTCGVCRHANRACIGRRLTRVRTRN